MRTIYPVVKYADARAAIDWLVKAFGFEVHSVHEEPSGRIMHAELIYGTGMIMLAEGERRDELPAADDWGVYVAVDDVDAHHDRAKAAGADIVMELTDQPYGSREYCARDVEGKVWSFGTFRP